MKQFQSVQDVGQILELLCARYIFFINYKTVMLQTQRCHYIV